MTDDLQFALEGAVKDRGKQGVKFGGGLRLQALEDVYLGPNITQCFLNGTRG